MKISTGIIIPIERDGVDVGEIRFDPTDLVFAERVYDLIGRLETLETEFSARVAALDANSEQDQYGIPRNARDRLALQREICESMHSEIDACFGAGTSEMVFGASRSQEAIELFLEGIQPYLEDAQQKRIARYTNRAQRRALRK